MVEICRALRSLTVQAPVQMGDVIAMNVLDTGVDVVATRDMPLANESVEVYAQSSRSRFMTIDDSHPVSFVAQAACYPQPVVDLPSAGHP